MSPGWEWLALGFVVGVGVVYGVSFLILLHRSSPWRHLTHHTPIYGAPDLYRIKGPYAKPNLRII